MSARPAIAAVVIGRNEGARLLRGLEALCGQVGRIVYVDSGSTDGSVAAARAAGAEVVELDLAAPFTAARARNAGLARLGAGDPPDFVQFIDGDCELQPGWIDTALSFLQAHPQAAVACGRRRERFPDASVYNRLCDREWDTPVGQTKACGGDALMRRTALDAVGGFDPRLIAGEEPELCVRLRAQGWQIWRLDAEMTLHDAAMTRLGQFWNRARRAGHAWAEGAALHGRPPERHGVAGMRRALAWGAALPAGILALALLAGPGALALLALYPAQVVRLALRAGGRRADWQWAALVTLSKFAEAQGIAEYHWRRGLGRPARLIEYK
ncbi:GT2 family glycosyltransferase [Rhodovulum iodosum]|uniref:GT2 family glycosyltransferase n=1 Tax=Rhodovulum iodosum TaxID=68291 RepID=A0ABV3XXX8_9RHOB|nr:glycosyltransferase [Rhodovulum robiginosum]RSK38873.1 glycosyltransferase [Rhodovulum robiginosum]